MARIYPEQISESTESRAERLLFGEFRRQLGDDYLVMHSVGWLSRNRKRNFDGEVDFLILHPDLGVLAVEVKGGTIEGEWSSPRWSSSNRKRKRNEIRNPFKQAYDSMYALKAKLEDDPRTADFTYPMFRGVAFPDMLVGDTEFGTDFDRSLVIDSSDLNSLEESVARMFGERLAAPLTTDAIQGLVDLLQPIVQITQIGLLAELKQGELVMTQLTQQQFRLLDFLRHHRQVVINGCAGSGKTMLAIEKARLLAEQGFEVLLTCYNKNLSAWIDSGVQILEPGIRDRITVSHYHDLAFRMCEEAGRTSEVRSNDPTYWEVDLPRELEAAIPLIETRFDAIVADEGQDFATSWWETLKLLLRTPKDGVFYIFQDEQQAIYRRDVPLPLTVSPHELGVNCRSTAQIHARVVEYYGGDPKPESLGPAGRGVEQIVRDDADLHHTLGEVVHRLVEVEGLSLDEIVILTPNGRNRSVLKHGEMVGTYALSWGPAIPEHAIRVSSVHAFKGLEKSVVILAEPERFARHRFADELVYVALSRARHHLIVVGELPAPRDAGVNPKA